MSDDFNITVYRELMEGREDPVDVQQYAHGARRVDVRNVSDVTVPYGIPRKAPPPTAKADEYAARVENRTRTDACCDRRRKMNEPRILLDDVLDTIIREVKEPDFGALQRWSARFPQFTDELTDFFAAWTMQSHEEDDVAIDAEGLANRLVSHALGTLHAKRSASAGG